MESLKDKKTDSPAQKLHQRAEMAFGIAVRTAVSFVLRKAEESAGKGLFSCEYICDSSAIANEVVKQLKEKGFTAHAFAKEITCWSKGKIVEQRVSVSW